MSNFLKVIVRKIPGTLYLLMAVILVLGPTGLANALTQGDINSVLSGSAYYDPSGSGSCSNLGSLSTGQISSIGLPSTVPDPYRTIITAAAAKFGADPSIVAAIFAQENGAAWPNPNESWPTSGAGAQGPMQFLPSTWNSQKVDGNGDGVTDINNIYDALYTGAKYIAGFGGVPGTPIGDLQKPLMTNTLLRVAASYNWGGGNVDRSGPDFPLSALNSETKTYVENVYAMLTSNFSNLKSSGGNLTSSALPGGDCTYAAGGSCTQGTIRQRVVNCAEQELALWNSGQLTPGTDYQKYTNGRPEDWCADFASWIYNQANYPFGPAGSYANNYDIAYTGNFMVPPQDSSKFVVHSAAGYRPQPGDVALHSEPGNIWYHTNLVDKVSGSTITLLGGNQSAVDGGGEYFTRSKVSTYPITGSTDDNIVYYISPGQDTSGSTIKSNSAGIIFTNRRW